MLRSADAELKAKGVTVIGVSRDPVDKQRAFCKKFDLPFDLLSDADGKICAAFGVEMERGIRPKRETFMFRNGKMIWHDPSVSPANQAKDVKRVIREVEQQEAVATKPAAGAA